MRSLAFITALLVAFPPAGMAEDKKPEKKAQKKSAGKKDDRNVAQKAESATGDFLHRNKIWTRREGGKKD